MKNLKTTIDWQSGIKLLERSGLCRIGKNENGKDMISFVHRRFQEYFLVESWQAHGKILTEVDYGCILDNIGPLDALVLYCEVAETEQVRETARFCWRAVLDGVEDREKLTPESVRMVYALQFMAEALPGRKEEAMADFAGEFETLVKESVRKDTHERINLAFVQSMILFSQELLQDVVLQVFQIGNKWLSSEVIANFQIIKKPEKTVDLKFCEYFLSIPGIVFLKTYQDVRFALKLRKKEFRYIRAVQTLQLLYLASFIICIPFILREYIHLTSEDDLLGLFAIGLAHLILSYFLIWSVFPEHMKTMAEIQDFFHPCIFDLFCPLFSALCISSLGTLSLPIKIFSFFLLSYISFFAFLYGCF